MMATNHVLTGALVGLAIHNPVLAVPLAFASHFALDALPHYGGISHIRKKFITILVSDMAVASVVLFVIIIWQPMFWQVPLACAVAAASPDLMWLPPWVQELRNKPVKPLGFVRNFHKKIQWAETPKNYPVEILWAVVCIFLLARR